MFLIPFAVIGYQVYDKHRKEEEAKKRQRPEEPKDEPRLEINGVDGTADTKRLEAQQSDVTDATQTSSSDEFSASESACHNDSGCSLIEEGPLAGIRKFFSGRAAEQKDRDPFRIRTIDKQLKYEVLGNQGSNALPFPKISYK